ncbi:MAG: hypothetical protein H6815_04630 [Phycisphaeraceae bacterium]|nr:hypothetical protein [Phycisphaerales bacterium]MCB9859719.1 hypothetical protein [Phycisphaeraceae bacterium]
MEQAIMPFCVYSGKRPSVLSLVLVCVGALAPARTYAQCTPEWRAGPGAVGVNGDVYALKSWDPDGSGPQQPVLVAGGAFTTAGGQPALRIASWNGSDWSPLGSGISGSASVNVRALAVLNDNSLVAAGIDILSAGGTTAWSIARWNGSAWSSMGTTAVPGLNNDAYSLHVLPNGDLIAGGVFTNAGGVAASRVASWNGTTWTGFPAGVASVRALTSLPNGDIIAGGTFGGAVGPDVSRWDGTQWNAMGSGLGGTFGGENVYALVTLPSGEAFAAGSYSTSGANTVRYASRFDGTSWNEMYTGLANAGFYAALQRANGDLVGGTNWTTAYPGASSAAVQWDGTQWNIMAYFDGGGGPFVSAMAEHNGELYVGGRFSIVMDGALTFTANGVARFGNPTPIFTQEPVSTSVCHTAQTQFSASATGGAPLMYEWQIETSAGIWTPLTTAPLALPCGSIATTGQGTEQISVVVSGCAGTFVHRVRAVATSPCGATPSTPATLKICTADCDCNAVLNIFDYICFGNEYASSTQYADCDGNGNLNIFDYICFGNAYAAGCP